MREPCNTLPTLWRTTRHQRTAAHSSCTVAAAAAAERRRQQRRRRKQRQRQQGRRQRHSHALQAEPIEVGGQGAVEAGVAGNHEMPQVKRAVGGDPRRGEGRPHQLVAIKVYHVELVLQAARPWANVGWYWNSGCVLSGTSEAAARPHLACRPLRWQHPCELVATQLQHANRWRRGWMRVWRACRDDVASRACHAQRAAAQGPLSPAHRQRFQPGQVAHDAGWQRAREAVALQVSAAGLGKEGWSGRLGCSA